MSIDKILTYDTELTDDIGYTVHPINLALGESLGHTVKVNVYRNGTKITDSASCKAKFLRSDGSTVEINGTFASGVASVTLPSSCYTVEGAAKLSVSLVSGSTISTVFIMICNVNRYSTTAIVDSNQVVPNIETLLANVDKLETLIGEAEGLSLNKVGYAEVSGNVLTLYSDNTKKKVVSSVILPSGNSYDDTEIREQLADLNDDLLQYDERISALEEGGSGGGGGLSEALKQAWKKSLEEIAYIAPTHPYTDALIDLLDRSSVALTSITAEWSADSAVVGTDTKTLISVVKANYSDGTSQTVTGYTVSPSSIVEGSQTVTVVYNGKKATKSIVGLSIEHPYSVKNIVFDTHKTIDTGVKINDVDKDWTILCDISLSNAIEFYTGKQRIIWMNETNNSTLSVYLNSGGNIYVGYMYGKDATKMLVNNVYDIKPSDICDIRFVLYHKAGTDFVTISEKYINQDGLSNSAVFSAVADAMKYNDYPIMIGSYSNSTQWLANATINGLDIYYKIFSDSEIESFLNGGGR